MTIKQLSEATPITTALAFTLCYLCFWFGQETSSVRARIEASERTQQQLADVVETLSNLAAANQQRINKLENRLPE